MNTNTLKKNARAFGSMVSRNLAVYFKNKSMVAMTFLTPVIMILLYALFLANMQFDGTKASIEQAYAGMTALMPTDGQIHGVINNWMMASIMGVSCISIAVSSFGTMVEDKQKGINKDFDSSPIYSGTSTLAYYVSAVLVTLLVITFLLCLCFIYLGATGSFLLDVADVFEIIGLSVLSVLSSIACLMIVATLINNVNAYSAFSAIFCTMIGFMVGAYMPLNMFPKGLQYACSILPGTHSSALFRNVFMDNAIHALTTPIGKPSDFWVTEFGKAYDLKVDFFGIALEPNMMYLYLGLAVILFVAIDIALVALLPKIKARLAKKK